MLLEYPAEIFGRNRTLIFSATVLLSGLCVHSSTTASLICLVLTSSFVCLRSPFPVSVLSISFVASCLRDNSHSEGISPYRCPAVLLDTTSKKNLGSVHARVSPPAAARRCELGIDEPSWHRPSCRCQLVASPSRHRRAGLQMPARQCAARRCRPVDASQPTSPPTGPASPPAHQPASQRTSKRAACLPARLPAMLNLNRGRRASRRRPNSKTEKKKKNKENKIVTTTLTVKIAKHAKIHHSILRMLRTF